VFFIYKFMKYIGYIMISTLIFVTVRGIYYIIKPEKKLKEEDYIDVR
jgi:hypothetical protein